jgi:excisionase family DNA binding protein
MISYRQLPPSEQEATIARTSKQLLAKHAHDDQSLTIQITDDTIELPAGAVKLLLNILGAMASGQGVTVAPDDAELSTAQTAEILHVSRPFLVKLLEEGQIPYRKVGNHRRVKLADVLTYKRESDKQSKAILDQLVAEAQAQGLYE